MRKGDNRGEKQGGAGKKEENNDVYTNIAASWLPEHQPTGKRTSCANYKDSFDTETTTANKSMGFDHSAINLVCDLSSRSQIRVF